MLLDMGQLTFDGLVDLKQAETVQDSIAELLIAQWSLGPVWEQIGLVQLFAYTTGPGWRNLDEQISLKLCVLVLDEDKIWNNV